MKFIFTFLILLIYLPAILNLQASFTMCLNHILEMQLTWYFDIFFSVGRDKSKHLSYLHLF